MILRSKRIPILTIALAMASLLGGCGQGDTRIVDLFVPDEVPFAAFTLPIGSRVSLRWTADEDMSYWLVYRNRVTGAEKVIESSASGGSYEWTVPEDVDPTGEYDLLAYDGASGDLLAQSAAFRVTDGDPTDSNGIISACQSDSDCDDSLYCNGSESCNAGACTNGAPPCVNGAFCDEQVDRCWTPCLSDAQCEPDEMCSSGVCVARNIVSNGLQGHAFNDATDEAVDFAQSILVGQILRLENPSSSDAEAAARAIDGACTCTWQADPVTAGIFDNELVCDSRFSVDSPGAFTLILDENCSDTQTRYVQSALSDLPPPPITCTGDDDCSEDMICSSGICVIAPPTPTIQLLGTMAEAPFVVRFDMRILDKDGAVIPEGVAADNFSIWENDVPVDLSETNQFVTPAPNLPLRVVLVLDYTKSMADADAIGPMVKAATEFVRAEFFTGTHAFSIVEFHDRTQTGEGFSTAVPLTAADAAGKQTIVAAIPGINDLEPGLSRVWDAVESGVGILQSVERKDGEVQAIVFLTDGRDTSSTSDPAALTDLATSGGIRLFPIAFGEVGANELQLKNMAEASGGTYFAATDTAALADVFAQVADELRGQWNLSYITPTSSGTVDLRIDFTWQGDSTSLETSFDAGQLAGDVNVGRIEVLDRAYDSYSDRTSFLLRAAYMPRNIDRFQFEFAHSGAELAVQQRGGLTSPDAGWSITPVGDSGYVLFGSEVLEFGAFGNIGIVIIPGDVPQLQIVHVDEIYEFFPQPKQIQFEGDLWAEPYALTVSVSPEGAGAVVVSPDKDAYGHGETVTLTALAVPGQVFDRWSGDSAETVTTMEMSMDTNRSVTAIFKDAPAEQ